MSLTARLREIERKIDPSTSNHRRPREIHESLQQIKAALGLNTAAEWVLTSSEVEVQLRVIPKEEKAAGLPSGQPFILVRAYNNTWPATVRLHSPTGFKLIGTPDSEESWDQTTVVAHNAKELIAILGDFLDDPFMLDWLKSQV